MTAKTDNDFTNALRPRHLNCVIFAQILYDFVPVLGRNLKKIHRNSYF